jgi:hypothetical protein
MRGLGNEEDRFIVITVRGYEHTGAVTSLASRPRL